MRAARLLPGRSSPDIYTDHDLGLHADQSSPTIDVPVRGLLGGCLAHAHCRALAVRPQF
jgi:hypothetical protein